MAPRTSTWYADTSLSPRTLTEQYIARVCYSSDMITNAFEECMGPCGRGKVYSANSFRALT